MINNSSTSVTPGVLQPKLPSPYCLKFEEESGTDFTFKMSAKNWTSTGVLETSTDGINWTEYSDVSTIVNSVNGKLYLRGNNITQFSTGTSTSNTTKIILALNATARIKCTGNIETLLDWQTVANGEHPIMGNYCFKSLFSGCKSLITAPELPATTLTDSCYRELFNNCTSLIIAPELPAITLSMYCYYYMFYGCTSLTTAPSLPATTLATYCYFAMFSSCRSLSIIPSLPATTLTNNCYNGMFSGCSKIKLSKTQTGLYQTSYRIPTTGTGIVGTSSLSTMFASTGGTFTGTPTIDTTYYTSNEVV